MPRFVILWHDRPAVHWDLLLEAGDRLFAWRLAELPTPNCPVLAHQNSDHRLVYLEFEGAVSGDRGEVRRVAWGEFDWLEKIPHRWRFRWAGETATGEAITGTCQLTPSQPEHSEAWEFVWQS